MAEAAYALLSLAFGAGGAWFLIRQSRKDVNGLGRKLGGEIERSAARHHNVTLALMLAAPEEKKAEIARLLRQGEGDS